MRTTIARLIVPIGLLAAACSKGGAPSGAVSDDLQKDLQAASSSKLELANQAGTYKPMRFVSEIEQSNGAVPVAKSRVPKPVATKSAGTQPEDKKSPAPESRAEVQVAESPAPEAEAPAPVAEVPSVPVVAPRPAPMPVDMPMGGSPTYGSGGVGERGGDGRGEGIGGIIGVIIRGGGVGVDHCPPPRRRGRRPPFINP